MWSFADGTSVSKSKSSSKKAQQATPPQKSDKDGKKRKKQVVTPPLQRTATKRKASKKAQNTLNPIVVTGSRRAKRLKDTIVATEVITQKDIKKTSATHLGELLETQLGLQVLRQSGAGSGLLIQGLDSRYVLILLDGQRMTGQNRGVFDLGRLSLDRIERIEIVKGASSALYGSDAIGGVINIITKRARKPLRLDFHSQYGYGGGNLFDASATLSFKQKGWSGVLTAGYHNHAAYDLDPSDKATTGSSNLQILGGGNLQYKFSRKMRLSLKGEYMFRDRAGIDTNSVGGIFDRLNRTETVSATLGLRSLLGMTQLRGDANLAYYKDQFLYRQRQGLNNKPAEITTNWLGQATLQLNHAFNGQHLLTTGLEGIFEHITTPRIGEGKATRTRGSLYAQHEWSVLSSPLLVLVPGLRLEMDSQFGFAWVPKLALRVDPVRGLAFRASYGWGYRAPTFKDLYLRFENEAVGYFVEGNPDLKPERSQSVQASVEWSSLGWFSVRANFFYNELTDLLGTRFLPTAPGEPLSITYTNLAAAMTRGVESLVRLRWKTYLQLMLGYTFTSTLDRESNKPLPSRPTHQGTFQLTGREPNTGLRLTFRGTIVGERRIVIGDTDSDGKEDERVLAPYVLMHTTLNYTILKRFDVFVSVFNLLNVGDPTSLPIRPRTFRIGLRGKF